MEAAAAGQHSQPAPSATRDWSELPLDAVASIFAKLGGVEVLMGAGLVCHSWLDAARVPDLWRHLDMGGDVEIVAEMCMSAGGKDDALCAMAREAVDRSCGQLEVFVGVEFVNDELLKYMAARAPSLKVLHLMSCSLLHNEGFVEAIHKLPVLEDLKLFTCDMIGGRATYEAVGKACPNLKRFEHVKYLDWLPHPNGLAAAGSGSYKHDSLEILGIAAMRGLRSLRIQGSWLRNETVAAILDGCPHLESLDLSQCITFHTHDDGAAMRAMASRL